MIFGRGGGGGVVNRVSKEAGFAPSLDFTLLAGAFDNKRLTADLDQPITKSAAFRVNALYENSDSFRQSVTLERYGLNPTLTILAAPQTRITAGYEHFRDAGRGPRHPSFEGRPADVDTSTYFGDPAGSRVRARADAFSVGLTHQAGAVTVRNRTLVGNYERSYQNYVPGAVNDDKTQVSLSAYNNDTERLNVFNQTDLISTVATGPIRHTVLSGVEIGRQLTDNFRNTGYFNNVATSISVPYGAPTIATPMTFRQSATDADNHLRTRVAAAYGRIKSSCHDSCRFSRCPFRFVRFAVS
jgi:catecholate siderophore receptor